MGYRQPDLVGERLEGIEPSPSAWKAVGCPAHKRGVARGTCTLADSVTGSSAAATPGPQPVHQESHLGLSGFNRPSILLDHRPLVGSRGYAPRIPIYQIGVITQFTTIQLAPLDSNQDYAGNSRASSH